ncbi:MAG: diguanylate cyclase [Elainella sp. C42_A2020_010]|nr:diguanylate cyclase [Elainella sp. C42_A2020_010]
MTPAKILVVDDEVELERLIRQRFRKKIQAQEFDFLFAADGVEALRWLQSGSQVDMVLTDINMPKMDGLTLLGQLSGLRQPLRAVVMSAYSDMSSIRRAMNQGAFDFLTKPIDFQDLELTIQKTLQSVQAIREQQALMRVAYYDSLTGLPNRSWFIQRLAQLIEQPSANRLYAVLFIDLDRFKLINDSFGHVIGDALLTQVAQRLQHSLQSCPQSPGVVARLGGDEFAILLEDVKNIAEVIVIVQQIQTQLERPFQIEEMEIYSQASIGITLNSLGLKRYDRPEELLRDADVAMYCAKAQGKGRFQVFDPTMQIPAKSALFVKESR